MSDFLEVYGARTHNLKNIDVKIPKNKMVIITGLSGSGKSSLAFSTIYSIGQQKYLESLSSYARMFVGGMKEEAEVDEIVGLSPTISIDQKTTNRNPRSTVGTITEIYDYYKLLYLNIGERKCVQCESTIKKDSLKDVITFISSYPEGTKFKILSSLQKSKKEIDIAKIKKDILDKWFIRFYINGNEYTINDDIPDIQAKEYNVDIVVDRLVVKKYPVEDDTDLKRLRDSLELAFNQWKWHITIEVIEDNKHENKSFSNIFVCSNCGHTPEKLTISSFSFNSPHGSCPECHGLGEKMVFLEEKIVNPRLTLEEGAILPPGFGNYYLALIKKVWQKFDIRTNIPYKNLTQEEKMKVLYGTGNSVFSVDFVNEQGRKNTYNSKYEWVIQTLTRRYFDWYDEKGMYDDYITNIECPECQWYRLQQESLSVEIEKMNIGKLSQLSVTESRKFFETLELSAAEEVIVKKVFKNICERLEFLEGVGLSYISLSRKANTLSGWEAQRIRLATQIGVKLEWIIYVLDEPSIGLHPRDNDMLIANLKKLRDIGNTLIVVEHDEDIMRESDYIIDVGPGAGIHWGEIIATGTLSEILKNKNSVTAPYLSGQKKVYVDRKKRKQDTFLEIFGATHHNLKDIDVKIPLWNLTVVTGVSGSGKSSLINDTLANYLSNTLNRASKDVGDHKKITGAENFDKVLIIDQSPIGKTPRSNPATYTGVFTYIREVFAASYDAKLRGYAPGRFSFNTREGRCDACDGDGMKKIEMHFLPPVYTECEECEGKRFNSETLEIKYKGKTIADILEMTIEEALSFFTNHPRIAKILQVLDEVGLGYLGLWQASTTLSGWEAQRIKLASELSKRATSKTIYILDEPTTGLHFQDVQKLLQILHNLVQKGNTVVVIEHNMNLILNADYIIDIGPEWGDAGGKLVIQGGLEDVKKCSRSYTGKAILKYLGE